MVAGAKFKRSQTVENSTSNQMPEVTPDAAGLRTVGMAASSRCYVLGLDGRFNLRVRPSQVVRSSVQLQTLAVLFGLTIQVPTASAI